MTTQVRWLIKRDMDEVLRIEMLCFPQRWTREDFMHYLRQRNVIGMVADNGHDVVGFMLYELHKSKLKVINFAVHPDWQRLGVGTAMVNRLKNKLHNDRRRREILLTVRESNLHAQLFFSELNFRAIGVSRREYEDTGEDGYQFRYVLPVRQLAGYVS